MSKKNGGRGPQNGVQPPKFYFYQTSHDTFCVSVNFGRDISKIFCGGFGAPTSTRDPYPTILSFIKSYNVLYAPAKV